MLGLAGDRPNPEKLGPFLGPFFSSVRAAPGRPGTLSEGPEAKPPISWASSPVLPETPWTGSKATDVLENIIGHRGAAWTPEKRPL